jgi:hypothetical protein
VSSREAASPRKVLQKNIHINEKNPKKKNTLEPFFFIVDSPSKFLGTNIAKYIPKKRRRETPLLFKS